MTFITWLWELIVRSVNLELLMEFDTVSFKVKLTRRILKSTQRVLKLCFRGGINTRFEIGSLNRD